MRPHSSTLTTCNVAGGNRSNGAAAGFSWRESGAVWKRLFGTIVIVSAKGLQSLRVSARVSAARDTACACFRYGLSPPAAVVTLPGHTISIFYSKKKILLRGSIQTDPEPVLITVSFLPERGRQSSSLLSNRQFSVKEEREKSQAA